jgi:hypothetical protein
MNRLSAQRTCRDKRTKRPFSFVACFVMICAICAANPGAAEDKGGGPRLEVELVASGLVAPLDLTFAPEPRLSCRMGAYDAATSRLPFRLFGQIHPMRDGRGLRQSRRRAVRGRLF